MEPKAIKRVSETPQLPDKLYFKIGEVSQITGIKPYVLRYWETEFPVLKPSKTSTKQRLYRKREVEIIFEIKKLLYDEKFTIAGARKYISDKVGKAPKPSSPALQEGDYKEILKKLRSDLQELKKILT